LADHGVGSVQIHYLSHDADLVPQNQPSYQVQQLIDGTLDVAAVWGPLAGYYKVVKHAPITLQPANKLDTSPLQFEMAIAVRLNTRTLTKRLDQAMHAQKDAIRAILTDYGVPLVQCDACLISGELPAHGPYTAPPRATAALGAEGEHCAAERVAGPRCRPHHGTQQCRGRRRPDPRGLPAGEEARLGDGDRSAG
jgi:hypothetical protein